MPLAAEDSFRRLIDLFVVLLPANLCLSLSQAGLRRCELVVLVLSLPLSGGLEAELRPRQVAVSQLLELRPGPSLSFLLSPERLEFHLAALMDVPNVRLDGSRIGAPGFWLLPEEAVGSGDADAANSAGVVDRRSRLLYDD